MCSSHSLFLAVAAASVMTAGASHAVSAGEMVRAYVLVDAKPGQKQAALQSLDGLGNCLSLTHSFMGDEIVAHLHCDGRQYLNKAIADNVTMSPAVERVTVLSVINED